MISDKEKPAAIILAGGESQRMGFAKGLLQKEGLSLLETHIQNFRILGLDYRVIVGSALEQYQKIISPTKILENKTPQHGPFSSILTAIHEISDLPFLIQPVDQYPLKIHNLKTIIHSFQNFWITMPQFQGKNGHPLILHPEFLKILSCLSPQNRLDLEIKKLNPQKINRVSLDDFAIITNLNSVEIAKQYGWCPPDHPVFQSIKE